VRARAVARAAVALSGGADSAAAAALMLSGGIEVLALTMVLHHRPGCTERMIASAEAVARVLGMKHHVIDLSSEFEKLVIRPFVSSYAGGLTPNPCVECNRGLKSRLLVKAAVEEGCSFLATGHYARVEERDGKPLLLRGLDGAKDQSYVLWAVRGEDLVMMEFPLGALTRKRALEVVREAGLAPLVLPESQDICFLSGGHYREAIERYAPGSIEPGPILDTGGRTVGTHRGLPLYTVGQRRGLGIGGSRPVYVLEVLPGENAMVVGGEEHLATGCFEVSRLNFVSGAPGDRFDCDVQVRYRGPALPASVELTGGGAARVSFTGEGRPAAPGQSAVFYRGEAVVGGGVIERGPRRFAPLE